MDGSTNNYQFVSWALAAERRRDIDREIEEERRRRLVKGTQRSTSVLDMLVDSLVDVFREFLGGRPSGDDRPSGAAA